MMEWILTSSVLILIIAALRTVLKGKISLRLRYALWGLVLLRLLCPVNLISSPTSILNATKEVAAQPEIRDLVESVQEPLYIVSQDTLVKEDTGETMPVTSLTYLAPSGAINEPYSLQDLLMKAWLLGVALIACVMSTCNLHFRAKLRRNRQKLEVTETSLPVYVSDGVETPCMFGLFHPTIYLTPESVEDVNKLRHVLEHELTHYYHGDYITAPLRCLALALHWYNPLVWWAAKASRLDGELACDEGTIERLGEGERSSYGVTLIQMTCEHPKFSDVMLTATTMSGSKGSIKERITCIAKKTHMAALTVAVVALIALIAVGCTFTGATKGLSKSVKAEILEHGEEYISEISFAVVREDENEPYVRLFLPEYMPKEGLTLELKAVREDGTEEILYTQDTIQLGEKYIFPLEEIEGYGKLKMKAFYLVDEKPVGLMTRDFSLEEWAEHQQTVEMAESVRHLMKEYAGEYFVKNMERHNSQLFLDDGEKYTGVVYQEPTRIATPMATDQNLYLYKHEGRFIREDGERITQAVYTLMHWGTDYWQRICGVDQETIDSYNTPEMVEKYGSYYDAAAMELYLKHKDDAVEIDGTTQISIAFEQETEDMQRLRNQSEDFILYTMGQDYPAQSLTVTVKDLRILETDGKDSNFDICHLAFYPETADGGRGMDYGFYLIVLKDEMNVPFFAKAYEAEIFANAVEIEGYASMDDAAIDKIQKVMQEQANQTENAQGMLFDLLQEMQDPSKSVKLSLNNGRMLEGRNTAGAENLCKALGSDLYRACSRLDADLTGNVVTLKLSETGAAIHFFESGYAWLEEKDNRNGYFEASGMYQIARMWYDEAELGEQLSTVQMITKDQGETPEEAARKLYGEFEKIRTRLSDGSQYKWSYVNIELAMDEEQTQLLRSEGKIEENAWCFRAATVFVPENERAEQLAGETNGVVEYEGEEPGVPASALTYTRMGVVVKVGDDWVCQVLPEDWY